MPGDQLPEFMEESIRECDHVIFICTPAYKVKSDSRRGGVGYEGTVITGELLTVRNERKFVPILCSATWTESAPSWALGKLYVDLSGPVYSEREYKRLLEVLHGQLPAAPEIGTLTYKTGFCRRCGQSLSPDCMECPYCHELQPYSTWLDQVRLILREGKKINAIALYREATGLGLHECKDRVEAMQKEMGL
jgi:RNA polymerase subunit RPABC4/transcription elongation factor Spt4